MEENKRIIVCLPVTLLEEVDLMIGLEKKNRSEIIREAMRFYLKEKRRIRLREEMRKGYLEMAQLNLLLAEEAFNCEEEARVSIESKLMECC
ncbi:MAG: ribbon-helix-helix protein, CopG family [Peptococcaceae bacterium]|jgi:CopG family transcriptional regulator/antitoxin EndoAI|nr:ribbon-helix-helix protein, CopG family [Peptococcaceae bacterium]MDH7524734.1 ribbon-helix-helix protein, CopG family [Peptococcaceae bacterium]